ncbi:uncharacterized protein LOC126234840 [Schistocerca nitens]|uniref:uncharacterized protein LOC126234840 n=1 Tax=Schistocerca nitens TaxID=7011 RepID=UPI002117E003|nr:uncharacterized protein LOC126234840 [Schistocerca nitens]
MTDDLASKGHTTTPPNNPPAPLSGLATTGSVQQSVEPPPSRRLISILTRRVLLADAGRPRRYDCSPRGAFSLYSPFCAKQVVRAGSRRLSIGREAERAPPTGTPNAGSGRVLRNAGRGRGGGRRAEHMAGHVRMRGRRGRWRWRLLWRRRMCTLRAALQRGRRLPVTPEDAAAAEATGAVGAEAVARAEAAKAPAGVWLLLCGRCAPACPRLHGGHLFPN